MSFIVTPIFGTTEIEFDEHLVFVLMPFHEDLTRIYTTIIKPTVEGKNRLICRRADDYKTNKSIIYDVWKAICQSHIVIADMTKLNPNVKKLGSYLLFSPS